MTKLDSALALAEQGFYVFRLKRNGKTPFAEGWQDEATRDPNDITELFKDKNFNIGVLTGRYQDDLALVVVDVDTKDGKVGNQTMNNLDVLGYDFPPTLTVTTASGGRHLIYFYDFPLSGGPGKIGDDVDLKSNGGYIVGAGSVIDEKYYEVTDNLPVVKAPEWIRNKVGRPMEKSALADTSAYDTPQTLARARAYVDDNAPEASSGMRNMTAFKVGARIRDFGVSMGEAAFLLEIWNSTKCFPPLDSNELEITINSVYKTASKSAANSNPNTDFDEIPDDPNDPEPIKPPAPNTLIIKDPEDITSTLDNFPLIENFLDQNALSILYGASNAGKTFVALDLAFHIATGKPWDGKRTLQGQVIYVAAEGGRSAENRIQALKKHHAIDRFPLGLITSSINLFDSKKDIKNLIQAIKEYEAKKQQTTRLIVVDTLSRALAGGNENDSQDMGEFVKNIDFIRAKLNAHLLIVHHSGKDQARGARGHSLLRAAVDTEIEVADNLITTTKQRDMEFAKPIGFDLNVVTLGENSYGKPVTSCTITTIDPMARADFNTKYRLEPRDLIALLALKDCSQGRSLNGVENVVEQKVWAQCCKDFDISLVPNATAWPVADASFNKAFGRVRDRLVAFSKVVEVEDKQWAILK